MFWEILKTAAKSLWSNKLRSFLTLLGVVIGIYAIVTILAMATGLQKQIADQVEGLGPRAMFVLPGETEAGAATPNFTAQFAPSTIFIDDVDYLEENAKLVEKPIDYVVILGGLLRYNGRSATTLSIGVTAGVPKFFGFEELVSGRGITSQDVINEAKVIFLNQAVVNKLGVALGDKLYLGVNELTLTGIYKDREDGGLSFGDSGNVAMVPATLASRINQSNQVSRILLQAKDVNSVESARNEIKALLTVKHGSEDFTVLLSSDLLSSVTQITNVLKYAVAGIAAISLLVGGIGISNIMLVTVTERTREIGIRKAVGATEESIMLQFLVEALLLTVVGSLLGLAMASVTTVLVDRFSPLIPTINGSIILLALTMGAVTGLIFGFFPAARAARQNPVQALKYE